MKAGLAFFVFLPPVRTELEIAGVGQGSEKRIGLRGGFAQGGLSKESGFIYLIS